MLLRCECMVYWFEQRKLTLTQSFESTGQNVSFHRLCFFTVKSSWLQWESRVNTSLMLLRLRISDGASDKSRLVDVAGLVLKHMYTKVGICEERVLVRSNPPTRITHVFHARLKGPMIPYHAVQVLTGNQWSG